ncbi:MAG TPA: pyridoxamine 5'-phosphate oxidase family protein [Streptosporangiaceae bacterium]|nr:pyridoxamine 5'-phosphate oxidase family protein [Streptosporangiaceae bacterium]
MSDDLDAVQDETFAGATRATADSYPAERRLSAGQLEAYLDRRAFAVIGSRRPDGRPHAAMSSYVRRGRDFWLPTVAGSVRERNLRAEPWLTMTVTEGDHDSHVVVLLEGPAEVIAPAAVPADVRATVTGEWVATWIRLTAQRVLSYAAEATQP